MFRRNGFTHRLSMREQRICYTVKITKKAIGKQFTLQVHQPKVVQNSENECCSWRCLDWWIQANLQQLMVNRGMIMTAAGLNSETMNTWPVNNGHERISMGIIVLLSMWLLVPVSQGRQNIIKGGGHCGVGKTRIVNIFFSGIIGIIDPCVIPRPESIGTWLASMS